MNRQYVQDLVSSLSIVTGSDKERISIALAVGIAYALELPRTTTEKPSEWYVDQYQWKVQQFVAEFNERFLIDIQLVISGVKEVWQSRYNGIHLTSTQEVEQLIQGQNPVSIFVSKYDLDENSKRVIAQAAFAAADKIQPVVIEMTNPSANV